MDNGCMVEPEGGRPGDELVDRHGRKDRDQGGRRRGGGGGMEGEGEEEREAQRRQATLVMVVQLEVKRGGRRGSLDPGLGACGPQHGRRSTQNNSTAAQHNTTICCWGCRGDLMERRLQTRWWFRRRRMSVGRGWVPSVSAAGPGRLRIRWSTIGSLYNRSKLCISMPHGAPVQLSSGQTHSVTDDGAAGSLRLVYVCVLSCSAACPALSVDIYAEVAWFCSWTVRISLAASCIIQHLIHGLKETASATHMVVSFSFVCRSVSRHVLRYPFHSKTSCILQISPFGSNERNIFIYQNSIHVPAESVRL